MDEWNEIKKENYEKKVVLMSEWGDGSQFIPKKRQS